MESRALAAPTIGEETQAAKHGTNCGRLRNGGIRRGRYGGESQAGYVLCYCGGQLDPGRKLTRRTVHRIERSLGRNPAVKGVIDIGDWVLGEGSVTAGGASEQVAGRDRGAGSREKVHRAESGGN